MRVERRVATLIFMAGAVAALILALQPMRFYTPGGQAKEETLPAQVVDCGTVFHLRNAPANTTEECDGSHVRRGILILSILA